MEQQELEQEHQRLKEKAIDLMTSPIFLSWFTFQLNTLFEFKQQQEKPTRLKRFLMWLSYFDNFFIGLAFGLVVALAFDSLMLIDFARLVSAAIEKNCGAK